MAIRKTDTFIQVVITKYNKKELDEDLCVIWPYAKNTPGNYGYFSREKKNYYAHRYVLSLITDNDYTNELDAAHECGNPSCINPYHLFWKTKMQNNKDKIKHGTLVHGNKSHFSKLSKEEVIKIRNMKDRFSSKEIGSLFGISGSQVSRILNNQKWKHEGQITMSKPVSGFHLEGDAFKHTMEVLDSAAKHNESLEVRFGCLVHDLGKALTPIDKWPKHHGHEAAGVPLVNALCDRLKLPNDLRRAGVLSAKYHMHVHNAYEMGPKGYVNTFVDFRNCIHVADIVAKVAWHDNEGRLPYDPYNGEDGCFAAMLKHLYFVKLSRDFSPEEIEQMTVEKRKQALHRMRINAVKKQQGTK